MAQERTNLLSSRDESYLSGEIEGYYNVEIVARTVTQEKRGDIRPSDF